MECYKEQIENLQKEVENLSIKIQSTIRKECNLSSKDKIRYSFNMGYLDVSLEYIGSFTIWPDSKFEDLNIISSCSYKSTIKTVKEYQIFLEEKESRKDLPEKVFNAYKKVIGK